MKKVIGYLILICMGGLVIFKALDLMMLEHGKSILTLIGFVCFILAMSFGFILIMDNKKDKI